MKRKQMTVLMLKLNKIRRLSENSLKLKLERKRRKKRSNLRKRRRRIRRMISLHRGEKVSNLKR